MNGAKEILREIYEAQKKLRESGVVRTWNLPTGDLAETIAAEALDLELEEKSNKGFDAVDPESGEKYEIKARRNTDSTGSFSAIRYDGESPEFDKIILIVFQEDWSISKACILNTKDAMSKADPDERRNAETLTTKLVRDGNGKDCTELLRESLATL